MDEYDTSEFLSYSKVSLGISTEAVINGRTLCFDPNVCMKFNGRNLYYCQYLSLRHSAFLELDLSNLISLKYIDIAFTFI